MTTAPEVIEASRRQARRQALFLLYQWDVLGRRPDLAETDRYARELVEAVLLRQAEFDQRLDHASHAWPTSRLGSVERSVLRLALVELERLPAPVAIAEAVKLTKRYASDEAAKLVNGILGTLSSQTD